MEPEMCDAVIQLMQFRKAELEAECFCRALPTTGTQLMLATYLVVNCRRLAPFPALPGTVGALVHQMAGRADLVESLSLASRR